MQGESLDIAGAGRLPARAGTKLGGGLSPLSTMLCGVLTLIRTNRDFGALCTARTVSFLGDTLSLVALLLYVADITGQALAVAALLLVGDVLPALLGPLAGALADRYERRRIMIDCELVQVGLTVLLALWLPSLPMLLVLVAARALAAQVFAPASRTAVGTLVAPAALPGANAALGLGDERRRDARPTARRRAAAAGRGARGVVAGRRHVRGIRTAAGPPTDLAACRHEQRRGGRR
jgi:MFS family permease